MTAISTNNSILEYPFLTHLVQALDEQGWVVEMEEAVLETAQNQS